MAQYKSTFKELGFYVDGELKRFNNGVYNTVDKAEIAVLDNLQDVQAEKSEAPTKASEAKPATKAPARKTSAK